MMNLKQHTSERCNPDTARLGTGPAAALPMRRRSGFSIKSNYRVLLLTGEHFDAGYPTPVER
jgi:hypothetical protein